MGQSRTFSAPYHYDYKAVTLGAAGALGTHTANKTNGKLIINIGTLAAPGNAAQTTYATAVSAIGLTIDTPPGNQLEVKSLLFIDQLKVLTRGLNRSVSSAQAYAGLILIEMDGNLTISALPIFYTKQLVSTSTSFGLNENNLSNTGQDLIIRTNLKPGHVYTAWTWIGANVSVSKTVPIVERDSNSTVRFNSEKLNLIATVT